MSKTTNDMNSEAALESRFQAVCSTCRELGKFSGPMPTNSRYAQAARLTLEGLAKAMEAGLPQLNDMALNVVVSRGQSTLPKILWVGIVPAGKAVSNSPSVAVCFGKLGEGAVAGLMRPASLGSNRIVTVSRTKRKDMRVDVDSGKPNTSYNDKFVNPIEFPQDSFSPKAFLKHLRASLQLLRELP